jgi:DNA polymerase III epsilon subunit-like protein
MIKLVRVGRPQEAGSYREYCGRAGKGELGILGNPFPARTEKDRDKACEEFETYLRRRMTFSNPVSHKIQALAEIAKKQDLELACFCTPKRCHTESIKKVIEEIAGTDLYFNNLETTMSEQQTATESTSETSASATAILAAIMDTETTGLLPTDQICSLAWLGLGSLTSNKILYEYHELFDITLTEMPFQAQKIHGISKSDIEGRPLFTNIAQVGLPDSVKYLVFHNAAYDWGTMLKTPLPDVKVICTMKLARAFILKESGCSLSPSGKFRSYKLVDLCSDFFPEKRDFIFSGAHGAAFDVKLTLLLLQILIQLTGVSSWEELYNLQKELK